MNVGVKRIAEEISNVANMVTMVDHTGAPASRVAPPTEFVSSNPEGI